jgi:hypothetical protein
MVAGALVITSAVFLLQAWAAVQRAAHISMGVVRADAVAAWCVHNVPTNALPSVGCQDS